MTKAAARGASRLRAGQEDVVSFLARPEAYGRPGGPVERIDTHISVIFLAGDRAYKMKRAVRLGYLDYSTLALRKKFCRAELRINRLTAPELYLDVVPVTREAGGGLALGGQGRAVEWLVEMARFDQDGLFDRLAATGRLDEALMTRVADTVFDLHQKAPRRRVGKGADAIGWVIDSNAAEIGHWTPAVFDRARARAVTDRCRAALEGVADGLDRRARGGMVRRCHGDLHLRNICLYRGRPTVFDAIEFSERINTIDIIYDLAFLLMDLEHRGLPGLANTVFNRYLARSGDAGGLAPLPLFLACRSAVRAHTNAETASHAGDALARERLVEEARAYLDGAAAFLESGEPRLIALGGPSGAGKSTIALALAPSLGARPGAVVLRSDAIRKRLSGAAPETRLGPAAYVPAVSRQVYRELVKEAGMALAAGYTVIADAVFGRVAERRAVAAVARRQGVPFTGLWLSAPRRVLEARVLGRAAAPDASDADVAVLRAQLDALPKQVEWRAVDVSGSRPLARDRVREILTGDAGGGRLAV